jgi:hypothetical protein
MFDADRRKSAFPLIGSSQVLQRGDSYKRMPEITTLAGATHPSPGTKTKIMGKVFRLFIHLAVKPASVHVGD